MKIVVFHNPGCGTSRNVLRIIDAAGYCPTVIEYVEAGWTIPLLHTLFVAAGISARDALRSRNTPAAELGLLEPNIKEATLIQAMIAHPILVNRPFVITPLGTKLCRPSGTVLSLLPVWPQGPFFKEDGSLLIGLDGQKMPE